MKTPTWGELEKFLKIDGWEEERATDHVRYRKVLPDGTVLRTRRSFARNKTMSPGRFLSILRNQLKVSAGDFWKALRTGKPVPRPSRSPVAARKTLPPYLLRVLQHELKLSLEEIERLSENDAKRLVHKHWSRPKGAR